MLNRNSQRYYRPYEGVPPFVVEQMGKPRPSDQRLPGIEGANDEWKKIQWYGNVDYNYMNRYFATLSLLGEANSRFGENADGLKLFGVKWALFPSVQLGWVLTNESWFPKNQASTTCA